jgi:serine/threonine protein kinase
MSDTRLTQDFKKSNFVIKDLLGSGSFGSVSSAYDKVNNKTVVIKKILKDTNTDKMKKKQEKIILSEVAILSQLAAVCHPYILCYLDFMEDNDYFYILTEYLGQYIPLRHFIQKTPTISNINSRKIIINLIQGLRFIHINGIVHRDIKPDNIMIDPTNMDIKYIDFGLACRMESCYSVMSGGTAYYMAPELLLGQLPETLKQWLKVDYWALGATLMEVLLHHIFIKRYIEYYLKKKTTNILSLTLSMKQIVKDGMTARNLEDLLKKDGINTVMVQIAKKYIFPLLKIDPMERKLFYIITGTDILRTASELIHPVVK